eukprot:CAMPEP_0170521036 /NCGR_PEP_ID=MMETSP0209-20121228/6367_1 /TAXON_ID=665100 ORGANISM="Litonotus pictus, Strain P1" /NCGR_SAMPLE_ID=MMETSP0209 /ASSEMBLY_ACC=CAM_ASM_000301 /LENGTH=198 /DNA_ID=CAMNT_0010807679 /DNA_START=153 /DNA_END=746 /DNA_ORIENTATION=-
MESTINETANELNSKKQEIEKSRAFCQELLKEFNFIRTKPKSYLKKIEYYEQFLKMTQEGALIMDIENKKIGINTYSSFEELTKLFDNETNLNLKPLEFQENLTVNLPNDPNVLQSFDYMANQFVMKKLGLSDQYFHFGFHSEFGCRNPELSAFMQILDDSNVNRPRRKNILNGKFSSVGISIGKISENHYACYVIFG